MTARYIHILTIVLVSTGLFLVVFVYRSAPKNIGEIVTRTQVAAGIYSIDKALFQQGVEQFRNDEFAAARSSFERADPEKRDAATQFFIAYSFYREGWGRVSNDDKLFAKGIEAADRVIAIDPDFRAPALPDDDLKLKTAFELRAELEDGLKITIDDFNPLRLVRERK